MSLLPATISMMTLEEHLMRYSMVRRFRARDDETFDQIATRVASISSDEQRLRSVISRGVFMPGGQILRGAGIGGANLYSCFVTGADEGENERDIAARVSAWTRMGAGVGVDVSNWVVTRNASGDPWALQRIVTAIAMSQERLARTGIERTATMINARIGTPGLIEAIRSLSEASHRHLNFGVLVTDKDMRDAAAARSGGTSNREALSQLGCLAVAARSTGNPGLIFQDTVNRAHPLRGSISACNPCAEQHLEPNEGCNLGSINLAALVSRGDMDWCGLREIASVAVGFLDEVVDSTAFPSVEARRLAASRRRLGLGVMGLATALEKLRLRYGSRESVEYASQVFLEIKTAAYAKSTELAKRKGGCSAGRDDDAGRRLHRNAYLTSVAPTGAISMLAGVSSGIEPIYARTYAKGGLTVKSTVSSGSEAVDVAWTDHLQMLSSIQQHVDNGISKTINLPQEVRVSDVMDLFFSAWRGGCKGISVFRVGSRRGALRTVRGTRRNGI